MGSNNQLFFQNAMAQNVSATGACIYGIGSELKVGDVIGVQYEGRKARCKIIWLVDAGALKKTRAGVQLVPEQDCPWATALSRGDEGGGADRDPSGRSQEIRPSQNLFPSRAPRRTR